jgi:hypothetical protein
MMKQMNQFVLAFTVAAIAGACSDDARIVSPPRALLPSDETREPEPGATPGVEPTPAEQQPAPDDTAPDPSAADPDAMDPEPAEPSEVEEPTAVEISFIAPRGACDVAERVGGFSIEKQSDFGVVQGAVTDGVVPTAVPNVAFEDATCKLLERRTLACIPACIGAETCGEDGACIPYPRQINVGEVTISGLTRETKMSPLAPGNSYFAPGADNPPYEVDREIVLSAAGGGEHEAFQLFGIGSEPLAEAPSWVLEAGKDLSLEWAAPASAARATVLVELTIDQHGSSPLSLSCEFPDTGAATVPSAIIDQLIGSGVSGFPNGRITRRTADHVDLAVGCVDLVVGSPLAAKVSVAGSTPCNGSVECPDGQVCNVALELCE